MNNNVIMFLLKANAFSIFIILLFVIIDHFRVQAHWMTAVYDYVLGRYKTF